MRAAVPILLAALLLAVASPSAEVHAQTPTGSYTQCEPVGEASIVAVSGDSCDAARAVAAALAAAAPDAAPTVLAVAGWAALRALQSAGGSAHDLVAVRPGAALRIRRPGPAPDLDGWAAGRELLFARPTLVGGAPVPKGAALCTSAFLVRRSGRLGGLSAAHCGGLRRDGTVQRRNAGLRRPPQPGIILGRVVRNLARTRPLDALVLPVPSGPNRPASAVVDRGIDLPPWTVAGPARAVARRRICLTGRTSGPDRCGAILGSRARRAERLLSALAGAVVRCTSIRAREGDSGGPVYTAPRPDGSVRAVGIATLVVGPAARMCFTPLTLVLDVLDARLVTAPR